MKMRKQIIQLLLISGLLFGVVSACKKSGDQGGNGKSAGTLKDSVGQFAETLKDTDGQSAGTVKDADGNTYNTVKIGNQVWMVENLKTTRYNDGTPIPNVTDGGEWKNLADGAYCNYDNLKCNAKIYGRLYNWYAVETEMLAPKGWHVPTNGDWEILEEYLTFNGYNYDRTKYENKIAKSICAKTKWASWSEVGTPGAAPENNNRSGLTALPGGFRSYEDGLFYDIGESGGWWSSTAYDEEYAYRRLLLYCNEDLLKSKQNDRGIGYSVRLVKD